MTLAAIILKVILDAVPPCYRDPRPTRSVWRFADEEVELDSKASPRPGPYRSSETPSVRDFQDSFIDPRYDEDLAMKSSRTGFTEGGLNVVRYMPEHAPGNALICMPTRESAKNVSKGRLASTLAAAAGEHMSDDPDDDATYTKFLRNMTVWITGSYSADTFREKWLRLALMDEVEVNSYIEGEGFTLDLAKSRFTGVEGATLLAMSKPKAWGSLFHRRWATGTCEVYLVECPHCGTWQELTFDGTTATDHLHIEGLTGALLAKPAPLGRLMFEHCRDLLGTYDKPRIARETYYQCVSGCRIEDIPRSNAAPRSPFGPGRWLRTNPSPFPKRRSEHISDLYSPYPETSFAELALKSVDCAEQAARDHFKNNHLGLPAREQAAVISERAILDCRSAYARGTCPFVPDLVTLNWDTQDDLVYWAALGFRLVPGRDLPEIALIDHGKAFHSDELLQVAQDEFHLPDFPAPKAATGAAGEAAAGEIRTNTGPAAAGNGAKTIKITVGVGDAGGHRTADIYETCLKSLSGTVYLFPSFGRGGMQARNPLRETVFKHGQREVTGYLYSDDQYKRRLYFDIIAKIGDVRKEAAERGLTLATPQVRLHLYADILETKEGEEFVRGLTKERTVERDTRKGIVVEWDENIRGNESGDVVKVGLVTFDFARPGLQRAAAARAPKPDLKPGPLIEGHLGKQIEYLITNGGSIEITKFDDDWAPAGEIMRRQLFEAGKAHQLNGRVILGPPPH